MNDQVRSVASAPIQQVAGVARPYRPSLIDRLMGFVDGLPGPYWLTLSVLFFLQSTVMHVLAWIDGWLPAFTFNPILLIFPVWLWGPLAIMRYLNSISIEALSTFRTLLDVDEETLKGLKDEFTTMPARGAILSGVIWSVIYVFLTYLTFDAFYVSYGLRTFFTLTIFLAGLISYALGSGIYYHSFRQLRLVNRTVKMVKQVNLFQLDPVYAFSRLTARTGVSWMIMLSLTLLLFPIQMATAPVLAILVFQLVRALAAFVLPLRFVNSHLVTEKRRLLAELDQRVERTLVRLHHCLDEDEMGEMEQLNHALTGLAAEREILTRIPTWPWRAGTLTTFLSAIVLPIVLFLVQLVIESLIGG